MNENLCKLPNPSRIRPVDNSIVLMDASAAFTGTGIVILVDFCWLILVVFCGLVGRLLLLAVVVVVADVGGTDDAIL